MSDEDTQEAAAEAAANDTAAEEATAEAPAADEGAEDTEEAAAAEASESAEVDEAADQAAETAADIDAEGDTEASAESAATDSSDDTAQSDMAEVQSLINRARRTHELIAALDLEKVIDNDSDERNKLNSVGSALRVLSDGGEVESHLAGVDAVVNDADPATNVAALVAHLDACGLTDRMGRLWSTLCEPGAMKPLEMVAHREGLPRFDIAIAPAKAKGSGYFGLFVDQSTITAASIAHPPDRNLWQLGSTETFSNGEELMLCLTKMCHNAFDEA